MFILFVSLRRIDFPAKVGVGNSLRNPAANELPFLIHELLLEKTVSIDAGFLSIHTSRVNRP